MFIMIDGIDGSGKSVQSQLLIDRLKKEGRSVEIISFPQYGQKSAGPVEEYLNGVYGTAEEVGPYRASILYAVDRFVAAFKIRKWLDDNKIVIANRYVASNMGHQGGKIKDPEARKKFFAWNDDLEYNIFRIPRPDLNIILHVPAGIAQTLVDKKGHREYLAGAKRDIHEDDLHHLQNAEEAYLEIARTFPNFELVECVENGELLSIEAIHKKAWDVVRGRLK
ncbi:MAG TPA: thymidylate kinase [Candidatus Magasanikbacteria bacterium]|nr:thymidylate kinase [Candidatus Magasanikbacteria bacterium]HBX16053.1 thymidylate kinase [Candidatus Magasanikbacteria bacterium]